MDNELKAIIGRNINTLLAINDKKQKDLAEYLGVKDNVVSYFVNGTRTPNIEQIKKIATFFNCSTDYLFGLSGTPTKDRDISFICDYTGLDEDTIQDFHIAKSQKPLIMNNEFERLEYQSLLITHVLDNVRKRVADFFYFLMDTRKSFMVTPDSRIVIDGVGTGYEAAKRKYGGGVFSPEEKEKKQGGENNG